MASAKGFSTFLFLILPVLFVLSNCRDESEKDVNIGGTVEYPEGTEIGDVYVRLEDDFRVARIRRDGSFVIPQVPAGKYSLEVVSSQHLYPKISILVNPEKYRNGIRAVEEETSRPLSHNLRISPRISNVDYFEKHGGINVMGLLKNPLVIPVVLFLVLMFLMKGMGPDTVREMQGTMKEFEKKSKEGWSSIAGQKK